MPTSRRLLIVGSLLTLSAHAGARSKADEDSIGALLVAHTEKWNLHDIDAWAEILHDDADWVHWGGGYTKEVHRTYYKASRMTRQRVEDLTFLAPDIALAHVRDRRYSANPLCAMYLHPLAAAKRRGSLRIASDSHQTSSEAQALRKCRSSPGNSIRHDIDLECN